MADFSQILSAACLGWGKGCLRFWGRSDQNCGYHGNRNFPLTYNAENDVSAFSQSPLIGVRILSGSDFSLRSYSPLSVPIDFEWGKWCLHLFSVTMNSVFIKLTGNEDRHKSSEEFEFRSYLTSHFGVTCYMPLSVKKKKKTCLQRFSVTFDWIFVKLAGNEDRHKSSNESEFWPDRIIHFGVICP